MRLRLTLPLQNFPSLLEKLKEWEACVVSKDESGTQMSTICDMEPGLFRECDSFVRNLQGRLEILAISEFAGEILLYQFMEKVTQAWIITMSMMICHWRSQSHRRYHLLLKLRPRIQSLNLARNWRSKRWESKEEEKGKRQSSTCNAFVGDAKQYREHFKTDWHKHNLKRKTRKLPPLTADECLAEVDMDDSRADLKDYSF